MTASPDRLATAVADRYRLERELGQGGMATVYLAQDLKHDRKVAIKVLRPELAAVIGAERFLSEIKTTANLQHPHILPLHDSGAADSFLFYVMPFVEGESLRDRLSREKQLPVGDAVRIATEVASALDYAHRHGVIHRDIKPENILLHDGRALVADFGIALAASKAGGTRMTETGMSLGTPHYMSPEQAMGERDITARSDVYALGCVLYEMLAGEPPFTGPTAQAIVAKVLTEPPRPLLPKRHTIPAQVEAVVLRALEKLPADRFASAAEFATALGDPNFGATSARTVPTAALAPPPAGRRRWGQAALIGFGAVALFAAGYRAGSRRTAAEPHDVGLSDSTPIAFTKMNRLGMHAFDVAPDGKFVVYVADRGKSTELWYRSLSGFEERAIPGTEGASGPFLSPDGAWVGFFSGDRLKKAPIGAGSVATLADVELIKGGLWPSPDTILVSTNGSVSFVDPSTGAKSQVSPTCDFPSNARYRGLVLCSRSGTLWAVTVTGDTTIGRLRFPRLSGSSKEAPEYPTLFGTDARVVDGRYLVFMSVEGALQAASFDPSTFRLGRVVTVLNGLRREAYDGMGQYALTPSGDLVYAPGENAQVGRLVRTRDGLQFDTLPIPPVAAQRFDLSPDGRTLALVSQGVNGQELWIYDLPTGRGTRWQSAWYIGELRWDPSGTRIVYDVQLSPSSTRGATLLGSPNSSQSPDTLLHQLSTPSDFVTKDLLLGADAVNDLLIIDPSARPVRADTIALPNAQYFPVLSPDRHWLAYYDNEADIALAPFPWTGTRYKVAEGLEPAWGQGGRLVYWSRDHWWSQVKVTGTGSPPFQPPQRWFTDPRFMNTFYRSHIFTRDGSEIYLRGSGAQTGAYLRVIPGFAARMERIVDSAGRPR